MKPNAIWLQSTAPWWVFLVGVLILGEPFTAWVGAGTLLVLAGIWLLARSRPA